MYKRNFKLQKDQLEDTLKKSSLKQKYEQDHPLNSPSLQLSQQESIPHSPIKPNTLVQFQEYNIQLQTSRFKQNKKRFDTQYQPMLSARNKNSTFNDPHGTISHNQSYRKRDEERLLKELEECRKELMVKDGQISMLQKLINQYLGKGNSESVLSSINMKQNIKQSRKESYENIDKIISDKDQKINQYLQKISKLTNQIKLKNQELAKSKYEHCKLQGAIQNLQNQIYLLKNKEDNLRFSKDLALRKDYNNQNHTKPNSFWEDEVRPSIKPDGYCRNIDDLQKRLDILKENRNQIERSKSRNKGKTARQSIHDAKDQRSWLSQTSKSKTKTGFQFHIPKQRYEQTYVDRYRKKQTS